jgi:DNA-binding response OmpR family regulator
MKILLVDNSVLFRKELDPHFKGDKFQVDHADSFNVGFDKVESASFDCIVLSPSIEEKNCLQLLKKLTNENRQDGIVVLVNGVNKDVKLNFFSHGADDVLHWPLDKDELEARIKAIVRRKKFSAKSQLYFANLIIDFELHRVLVWSSPISLTKKEYEILLHLIANKNRVLSKEALAGYLWSDYSEKSDSFDFLFAHLKNLKKKLKEAKAELVIKNIYGVGYQIEEL